MLDMKTITLSGKGQISIPKQIREELKLEKGEKLLMVAEEDRLVILRLKDVEDRLDLTKKSKTRKSESG